MDLALDLSGRGDLTARIYRHLRDAILDGRLRPDDRLPATRELARRLAVSRNTVALAYDRLAAEGFVTGRVGAGTFVCGGAADGPLPRTAPAGTAVAPRERWRDLAAFAAPAAARPGYDFGVGVPDARLFPLRTWRRLVARALTQATIGSGGYRDPAGPAELRAAIARHVGVSRSVRAGAGDVLVTQGAQQALDLVGRVLIEPGDRVAVEEPGYPPARQLFATMGADVRAVPVDGEGLDVSALPGDARLVYTTPSHQFPLGTPMSPRRRGALLAWAARHDAVIVEDDYDSEFRFSDRPLEPLQGLDRDGRVIYVGTFSKTLLPVLRAGFLVAPPSLLPALTRARQLTDWHGDLVTQTALARFIDEGLLARHLRRATREYAARREQVLTTVADELAGLLEVVPSTAGLHVCARSGPQEAAGSAELARRALDAGVAVGSLPDYCATTPGLPGLVIGYGAIAPENLTEGLRLLVRAVRHARPG